MFFTHPVNRFDLPFTTLSGLVDCDRYTDTWIHFPAHWHNTRFQGVLPKGTPIAQCIPVKRENWIAQTSSFTEEETRRVHELQNADKTGARIVQAEIQGVASQTGSVRGISPPHWDGKRSGHVTKRKARRQRGRACEVVRAIWSAGSPRPSRSPSPAGTRRGWRASTYLLDAERARGGRHRQPPRTRRQKAASGPSSVKMSGRPGAASRATTGYREPLRGHCSGEAGAPDRLSSRCSPGPTQDHLR